jgi:hypothetical protein
LVSVWRSSKEELLIVGRINQPVLEEHIVDALLQTRRIDMNVLTIWLSGLTSKDKCDWAVVFVRGASQDVACRPIPVGGRNAIATRGPLDVRDAERFQETCPCALGELLWLMNGDMAIRWRVVRL